jgi:hypothetical protein
MSDSYPNLEKSVKIMIRDQEKTGPEILLPSCSKLCVPHLTDDLPSNFISGKRRHKRTRTNSFMQLKIDQRKCAVSVSLPQDVAAH